MKIASVSIWIWAIGLVVFASGIIAVTSGFSEKGSQNESHEVDLKLKTTTTLRPSNLPDTVQTGMLARASGSDHNDRMITSPFLPSNLGNWKLGMSLGDFKKEVPGLKYAVFDDFRITTQKINPCPDVSEITAYFDLSSETMLYELIVKYSSDSAFDRAFGLVMSYPQCKDNWLIAVTEDTYVRIWSFDKTFVYKYLGSGPEHEEGGITTATQLQERRILKLLK